ncbi:hypothetical protein H6G54_05455 [Anabaena cylindrica FACHB-243]|uniref:Uncharacterized protein n=1 Tax=Anabaena cylindrica (strain ATCC 27899 / PCC 7122) TaxID=272123 RepID=K9ZKP4_ANACC|nr:MULTISPECIES: hypothetical protein [Anabaena]AFZ59761.1 hypothetical protein Anacy_4401 [Anabaena cylindrica PCC 7122]MBD2417166.1 hypothetical protein [Anabaena cylindrica FACHB-243]MBY5283633.1 hypothetical protein [Anabaena sp. CCAP 1446/1C]MBY5309418.1 hypothetical protein [Anabaena sp. CCAP 1446/1C]MCM2405018.1 hypothetical protein [Anabaena sp. CCAP 1446/1C]
MLQQINYFQYLKKSKNFLLVNQKFCYLFLRLLAVNIMSLNLLLAGCQSPDGGNKAMSDKRERLILQAKSNLEIMLKEQEKIFLKKKEFTLFPDRFGKDPSLTDWLFTDPSSCYGYYSRAGDNNTNVTNSIYLYAFQDACKDQWRFRLNLYVGAIFAVPISDNKQLKTISILCKENRSASLSRKDLPPILYNQGLLKCPAKTTQVYFNESSTSTK